MNSAQQSFTFAFTSAMGVDDFITSPTNQLAYNTITAWPQWTAPICLLYGPEGCGKTHLIHIWAELTGAKFVSHHDLYHKELDEITAEHHCFIIEDIETIADEVALFHFYNHIKAHQHFLIMTSNTAPNHMTIRLPDLHSRLKGTFAINIDQPDDTLLQTVLAKLFSDQQLTVNMDVIQYLAKHMERSFTAARNIVDRINQQALKEHKKITVPFIRSLLQQQ